MRRDKEIKRQLIQTKPNYLKIMTTTFKEENNNYVMFFEGRLDTAAAPQVEKEVQPLNDCTGHDIILDCSKLDYISSSGLRIFLAILKNAKPTSTSAV